METESHTVTLPVDDYNKMRDFYENRELYDVALSAIITSGYHQDNYNRAKETLNKKGIDMVVSQTNKYDQKFEFRKVSLTTHNS